MGQKLVFAYVIGPVLSCGLYELIIDILILQFFLLCKKRHQQFIENVARFCTCVPRNIYVVLSSVHSIALVFLTAFKDRMNATYLSTKQSLK